MFLVALYVCRACRPDDRSVATRGRTWASDSGWPLEITKTSGRSAALEVESRRLAQRFVHVEPNLVTCDATLRDGPYDKTLLLMLGQERASVALVLDGDTATFAAAFDSGINFLTLLGISGGMPTRVSIPRSRLEAALLALGVPPDQARTVAMPR